MRLRTSAYLEDHVNIKRLVPGDIIMLHPGDVVPTDCLLLETTRLRVSHAALTGERVPQEKSAEVSAEKDKPALLELQNIVFMGTSVVSGTGVALVVLTGDRALASTMRDQLDREQQASALRGGVRSINCLMGGLMAVMVALVVVVRATRSGDWNREAQFGLTVAAAVALDLLPVIIDTCLLRSNSRLRDKGILVKHRNAIQDLGTLSILCSNKTGTLTKHDTCLVSADDCSGQASDLVLRMAYTNALHQKGEKNAIDAAILGKRVGPGVKMSLGSLVTAFPFESEKRRSGVVIDTRVYGTLLICKGAFEEVIALCTRILLHSSGRKQVDTFDIDSNKQTVDLGALTRQSLLTRVHALNDEGLRVLGVATRVLPSPDTINKDVPESALCRDLVFQGLLTFMDSPRDDANMVVFSLQRLGVELKVLTRDNARVALKICRSLEMRGSGDTNSDPVAVTGPELEQMSKDEFQTAVRRATVLAKLTPAQKGDVVRSLKRVGQTVGMLGHGTNDYTALSAADLGIAVGGAVTSAQACADVILTEKRLKTILSGIRAGRLARGNISKYLKFVTAINVGTLLSILIASAWLPYYPMTPVQILIQSLLLRVSQLAIPWDTVDSSYLAQPPRACDIWELLRFVACLAPIGSVVDMATIALGWFLYDIRDPDDGSGVAVASSHWFLQGLLTQMLLLHVLRTREVPFSRSRSSHVLGVTSTAVVGVGSAVVYIPTVATALDLARPADSFMGFLALELVACCVVVQVVKWLYVRRFGRWI
jgi:Mg2+-importing ATPase